MDCATAQKLKQLLGLRKSPVAIAFRESAPENVTKVTAPAPSGCSYWKYAAEGKTFYTTPEDHYNCPIGAYTHNVELPDDRKHELEDVLGTMFSLEYVREEEIPGIPRRDKDFEVAVYAPLADATFEPDVVLISGNAKQMMVLSEAAGAAGVSSGSGVMGRPTCAAIPQSINTAGAVASLGCIGNRVYNAMDDGDMYFALPAQHADAVVAKLDTIVNANNQLKKYHQSRLETIGQNC